MKREMCCLIYLISLGLTGGCSTGRSVNVLKTGAIGDGKALCTGAFQNALDTVAKTGGEVVVPTGNFMIGSVVMRSNTTLRLEKGAVITGSPNADDYPIIPVRWEGRMRDGHRALIHANDAHNIAIVGQGTINGDMELGNLRNPRGPCIFEPVDCDNVRLENIKVNYRRMWTIHLTYCDHVIARGLIIRSTRNNGDGIDVDSSTNVRIEKCDIDTGDDSIALKSGRGMEGVRTAKPTENVTITDCRLGSSFAGLAFGTEMSGGIRNVHFSRCTFTRGANSIFIKSRTGRGGFMEDIVGDDLTVAGAKAFLRIDLIAKGNPDTEPVEGPDAYPRVGNIKLSNVNADCDVLVDAKQIAADRPVVGLAISNVTGKVKQAIVMNNINNVELKGINVNGFAGALLTTNNVTAPGGEQLKAP